MSRPADSRGDYQGAARHASGQRPGQRGRQARRIGRRPERRRGAHEDPEALLRLNRDEQRRHGGCGRVLREAGRRAPAIAGRRRHVEQDRGRLETRGQALRPSGATATR